MDDTELEESDQIGPFPKTSHSLFLRIFSEGESSAALEEFFQKYWYPMYVFARSLGESHHDASDLVQGFVVAELLRREQLKKWNPGQGQLRTFLKVALDHYRLNAFRKESAKKRGGDKAKTHVSMDFDWAKVKYDETASQENRDCHFDRVWAQAMIDQAFALLAERYAAKGRSDEFQLICKSMASRGSADPLSYREVAEEMGISETNVKKKASQFRKNFETALKLCIAETVLDEDVDEEIAFVRRVAL